MKVDRQSITEQKAAQEKALAQLMEEFSERKDIEIRAKIEVDEIQKQLRLIQKSRLTALENDKRRELERLAAEREAIRLKEQGLLDEVQRLNDAIQKEDDGFKKERERLQNQVNSA